MITPWVLPLGKSLRSYKIMAMIRSYDTMFALECDDLILQMFQFFFSIKKHHPDMVKTHMQSILSSTIEAHDSICKKLKFKLLAIWRKEQIVSLATYELAERLVK